MGYKFVRRNIRMYACVYYTRDETANIHTQIHVHICTIPPIRISQISSSYLREMTEFSGLDILGIYRHAQMCTCISYSQLNLECHAITIANVNRIGHFSTE